MKKSTVFCYLMIASLLSTNLAGCAISFSEQNVQDTKTATNNTLANQSAPTDLDSSLEISDLISCAYLVSGQQEKANAIPRSMERSIGYIILLAGDTVIATYTVDGKVRSGGNTDSIYWFTAEGHYMEWNGQYLYSDTPFHVENPVIEFKSAE